MAIDLMLSNGERLEFQSGFPFGYSGPLLHGAQAISAKTNIAELVVQEIVGNNIPLGLVLESF